jgi:hypothetical protein
LAGEEAAVPGQQGAWRDQPAATHRRWQQPGQGCQDRPVGPVRLRQGDLAPEHHHLVAQHHDLRVLGGLVAAQHDQPAEDPDHDQVQETDRHEPRSCPNSPIRANRRSPPLQRVLERYSVYDEPTGWYRYTKAYVKHVVKKCSTPEGFEEATGMKPRPIA